MAIHLGRPLPAPPATNPGGCRKRLAERPSAPIRSCSRRGLPCRPVAGTRCALPHPFTLAAPGSAAVCFLWHFPWGRPRRTLSGTVLPWSPDFPPRLCGTLAERPSGLLTALIRGAQPVTSRSCSPVIAARASGRRWRPSICKHGQARNLGEAATLASGSAQRNPCCRGRGTAGRPIKSSIHAPLRPRPCQPVTAF